MAIEQIELIDVINDLTTKNIDTGDKALGVSNNNLSSLKSDNVLTRLSNLELSQGKNRGTFATSIELPSATNGDYAFVIATTSTWIYNNAWIDTETDLKDNFLNKNNNLSELDNKSVARQNLSVYSTGDVDNKLTAKQNITDNTLNTIDKTIVGAINENLTNNPSQTNDVSRYVNPYNGNDTLNGEQKRKKKTIASAITSLAGQSSASIFLDNGTYNEVLTWGNSANRFSLIGEVNGDERCVLSKGIVVGENNGQCAFQNLKFDNATGICLDFQCSYASPTLTGGNHIINNINIGGNVTNPTAIKYGANYGGTYTMIIGTDLNNKILEFENLPSGQRKIAYLYDASNSPIKAGTGWSVFKNKNCANLTPLTRNNNIFKGEFANGIISNETEYNIIIGLGAVAYGFYLANYTKAGYFVTGDVLLIMSSTPVVQEDYLSAENTYYNLSNGKTYIKKSNLWQEVATSGELALKQNKTPTILSLPNFTTDGNITTAQMDANDIIEINQTSQLKTITLASPTNIKKIILVNKGTADFTINNNNILRYGYYIEIFFNGTNLIFANEVKEISLLATRTTGTETNITNINAVLNNKLDNTIATFTEQVDSPSSPTTGKISLYFKNDEKLYKKNSSGAESEVGSGGGSGGHVIKDDTTTFTQRSNLQFTGDGVSVTDDNVNDATKITITGGSGDTGLFSLPVNEPIIAGDVVYQDSISGKWKKIVQVVAGNSSEIIAQGSVTSYSEDYSATAIGAANIPSYKNSYLYNCCQIDSNRVLLVWKSGRDKIKARIKTINGVTETLGPVKELTGLTNDYNFILDTHIAFNSSLAVVLIGQSTGDSASTANKRPGQTYALGIQIAGDVIQNLQLSIPVQTWSPLPTYSSGFVQMFFRKYANYLVFFGIASQTNAAYIETRTVNPDGSLGSRVDVEQVNMNYGGQSTDYIRRNFFDITLNGCFIIKDEGGTTTKYGFISSSGIIILSSTPMTNIGNYQSYRTFPHPHDPNKLLYIIGTNSTDTGGVWRVGIVDCTNASPTVAPTLIPDIKIIMADQVGAGAHPNYYDFQMPSANVIAFIYEPYANRGILSVLTTSISGNTIGDFKFTGTVIAGQLRTITSIAGLDWTKVKVGMSIHGSKSTSTVYTQQDTRVVSFINGVSITVDKDILTATTGIDFNIGTIIDAGTNSGDYSWPRRIIALDGKLSMFNYGSDNNFHSSAIQFGNTNSVSPSLAHGIAIETQNTIDQPCNVALFGKGSYVNNNATYIPGLDYYIQADGTIGSTVTDYKIGRALTTTKIELFNMIRTAIITSTNNTEIIGEDALYLYKWTYKSGINAGVDGKIYLRRIEKSTNIFEDFLTIDSSSGKLTMKNRATTPPISLNNEGSIAVINNKLKVSENGISWKSVVPEVVNCYLSSQATNTGQGDHIKFDAINGSNTDNIIVDIATAYSNVNGASSIGRITLKAGGTYEIRGFISKILTPASGIVQYSIYNANDGTRLLGSAIGTCVSATNTTDTVAYGGDAEAIITTTIDIKIELRIESNVPGLQIPTGSGTALFIKKIS